MHFLLLSITRKYVFTHYPHNPSLKVTMRIQIKLTKCEEIGIFCRNFAEKFILKFAKLFYIKKHEDSCHSPAQFVISNKK